MPYSHILNPILHQIWQNINIREMIPQERFPGRITLYITKQCMRARKKEPKYDQLFYHLESLKWMRLYGVTLNPWQFTPVTLTIKMPAIIKWDIWIARLRGLGFPEDGCNIQTPTMNPPSLPPRQPFLRCAALQEEVSMTPERPPSLSPSPGPL